MKVTKRFLLTLAAVIGMMGVWAEVNDTGDEVPVTATGNTNEWTLTMPASNVEVEVEYDTSLEFATLTTAPTAVSNLVYTAGQAQALVTAGTATGGTLSYGFGTAEAAPAPGTWSADIPTATDVGTYYVWYRVLGDDTHNGVAAAGPLTVKILTSAKVGLTMTGNSGTGSTASLLKYVDGTFVPLASTDIIKEGDKFVLYVNKTDGYDFGVTLSAGDLSGNVSEFSKEDYQNYVAYAKAQGIAVPLNAVLAWVKMPYMESGDLAVTVNFKQPKTYTVLYRPTGPASEVWCRIGMKNAVTGMHYDAVKMKNDTQVGDQQAWAAKILAADAPTQVVFFTTEAAAKADNATMSNSTVSQSTSTWTTIGSDQYLMIGGNAKTVVAAFVTDGNSMPVYYSSTATLNGSTSTTGVTYRIAVCPTDENGNVTSAGSVTTFAPTAPAGKQFLNWSVLEGTAPNKIDKRYDANESVSIRENTIFTAVWKPITVAATLNLNGGTGIDNLTSTVDYNNVLPIGTPSRQGFVFNGWTVNQSVTENGRLFGKGSPFDLTTPLTANLGLTAQWKHVHAYKGYKISDFGSALSAYQKYESVLHVAVCGCNDIELAAHTFSTSGKCTVCGYTKPGSTKVTLDVSYGVWSGGTYTEKMKGFPQEGLQKNQEVTISAPGWLSSTLEFQKWQYSTNGTKWHDLAAYDYVGFLIPCDMKVRALYVNPVTAPQVELSARNYVDKAVVDGQTYNMDNVLYQMNYKLPDGCTLLDAGIRMGDNQGISYYELKERTYTMDAECKAIGVGICAATFILGGGDINTFDASASEKYYAERENSALDEMSASELAKYMYESKPVNVEKYDPIYWEAKAPTKALSGSMATMPPLRFIQKNNGQHYIYGIGYMRYKDAQGNTKTIYTDALPATRDNIPANSVTKTAGGQNAPARRAAASVLRRADGDSPTEEPLDMSLVLAPETQLTVYVDGKWSDALSDSYGFGEKATVTAPATVDGKNFAYWEAEGQPVSSNSTLTLTMNANTTLRAVYDGSAPQNAGVGLTSVTRSSDGSKISLQAIADAQATEAGIIYSTSASGDALTIGGTGVTQVAAETITDATELPQSVLDQNKNWMLQIKAADETTVYHVRAYATIGGTTVYSDVKDVTLAGLESGIQRIANLGGFEQDIDAALESVANQIEQKLDRITVTIPAKSFVTRYDTGNRQMETSVSGVTLHSVQSATSTQVQLTDAIGVVAAEMPYIIYNDNDVESSVSMVKSTESADQVTYDSQHFKGTLAALSVTSDDMTSNDYYICNGTAFVWVKDAGNIAANKAWIQLPKNSNARKLNIVFGDATGIGQLDNLTISRLDNWYDLSGRKLQGRPTEKGVYIRNGKKVVVN